MRLRIVGLLIFGGLEVTYFGLDGITFYVSTLASLFFFVISYILQHAASHLTNTNLKHTFFSSNCHDAWSAVPFSILCKGRHINTICRMLLKIRDVYSFRVAAREY